MKRLKDRLGLRLASGGPGDSPSTPIHPPTADGLQAELLRGLAPEGRPRFRRLCGQGPVPGLARPVSRLPEVQEGPHQRADRHDGGGERDPKEPRPEVWTHRLPEDTQLG